jgi:hypothetical protein
MPLCGAAVRRPGIAGFERLQYESVAQRAIHYDWPRFMHADRQTHFRIVGREVERQRFPYDRRFAADRNEFATLGPVQGPQLTQYSQHTIQGVRQVQSHVTSPAGHDHLATLDHRHTARDC